MTNSLVQFRAGRIRGSLISLWSPTRSFDHLQQPSNLGRRRRIHQVTPVIIQHFFDSKRLYWIASDVIQEWFVCLPLRRIAIEFCHSSYVCEFSCTGEGVNLVAKRFAPFWNSKLAKTAPCFSPEYNSAILYLLNPQLWIESALPALAAYRPNAICPPQFGVER